MGKRIYKRLEDLVDIEFMSTASEATTIIRTKARDISAGGVKVFLNHPLQAALKMQLSITLPHTKKVLKAEAEVVTSELIGVVGDRGEEKLFETRFKFIKIDPDVKNAITKYVFECRRKSHDAQAKN